MAISTYAELKTAIQNWAKRSDILSVIDDFIDLAEADIWQRLRIRDMESRDTASPTGTRYIQLPDNFVDIRQLRLISGTKYYPLTPANPESMVFKDVTTRPSMYTTTTQIEFNSIPDSTYTIEIQYFKSLTALSSSNTSNAVLTRFPMIYLYGALFHYAQWAQDDEYLAKYNQLFHAAIVEANQKDRKGRHGKGQGARSGRPTP